MELQTTICVPGQRVCKSGPDVSAGRGTYVLHDYVYASLAGYINSSDAEDGKTHISVHTQEAQHVVPSVGSTVSARVTNVNPRFCKCIILTVDGSHLKEAFRGLIRREDVRATERDKVEMYKCYRPGDIILAKVLSLGDAMSYVLTTAENELGVVIASSEAGVQLIPISWCEMQCPKTLCKELRKVAKVQARHIEVKPEFKPKS